MAENYLQHAEHYNRIIAAAQAQMPIQHVRDTREDATTIPTTNSKRQAMPSETPAPVNNGSGPQPVIEGTPAEVALNPEAVNQSNERRDR